MDDGGRITPRNPSGSARRTSVSAEDNEAIVRRYFEQAWDRGNLAAVDEFMAPDYVEHQAPESLMPGRDSLKQLIATYHRAFPNLECTIHDILAQGDRVAYRWSATGSHLGHWVGIPPTGNHITARGITIYRIVEGKAVEGWASVDISRSAEELRWLVEGGQIGEAYPKGGDDSLSWAGPEHSPANDPLARNLTWRFRAAQARERERLEQELQVARRIQQELLPEVMPELDGWQVAAYYRPAREVGGDFYDFWELSDGRLGLVVGDATGHGMPAALVMATARGMLRAVAQPLDSPGEVLTRVNDALCPDIPPNTFVTCFYAILDPVEGRLRYANAGQDLPYLRHQGKGAVELRATGMPLGLMPGMGYEEREASLEEGDDILFYSDGLVEAHDARRQMFGLPRLRTLIAAHGTGESEELVNLLLAELERFTGGDWEQEDDITLVSLRRMYF
jgi:steroid delta-isomerase-like uncharacterized protein